MAEPHYGVDLKLLDGFEAHFPEVSGRENLLGAAFRRVTTSPSTEAGQGIYEGKCIDARDLFLARLDATRLPSIARQIEQACTYDERIESAACRATFNFSRRRLDLAINLTPADGSEPFTLILSADSVTVEILNGDLG